MTPVVLKRGGAHLALLTELSSVSVSSRQSWSHVCGRGDAAHAVLAAGMRRPGCLRSTALGCKVCSAAVLQWCFEVVQVDLYSCKLRRFQPLIACAMRAVHFVLIVGR